MGALVLYTNKKKLRCCHGGKQLGSEMAGLLLAEGLAKEHCGERLHGRLLFMLGGVGPISAPGLMTTLLASDDKGSAPLRRATLHAQMRLGLSQPVIEPRSLRITFALPGFEQNAALDVAQERPHGHLVTFQ